MKKNVVTTIMVISLVSLFFIFNQKVLSQPAGEGGAPERPAVGKGTPPSKPGGSHGSSPGRGGGMGQGQRPPIHGQRPGGDNWHPGDTYVKPTVGPGIVDLSIRGDDYSAFQNPDGTLAVNSWDGSNKTFTICKCGYAPIIRICNVVDATTNPCGTISQSDLVPATDDQKNHEICGQVNNSSGGVEIKLSIWYCGDWSDYTKLTTTNTNKYVFCGLPDGTYKVEASCSTTPYTVTIPKSNPSQQYDFTCNK